MRLRILLGLLIALATHLAFAQAPATLPQSSGIADSTLAVREQEIVSEYGFRDSNKISEVAEKLEIKDLARWKSYLGFEADNRQIDNMTLRKLGITPYRALLAQQYSIYGFTEQSTLSEVSNSLHIPIKKLKQMLELPDPNSRKFDNRSLQALDFSPEQVQKVADEFGDHTIAYGFSITAVGMGIVFLALLITSIIVGQLKHLNREAKPKAADLKLSPGGKVTAASATLNQDIIVALIAALHLHKQSIEDKRKLALTFRRTPTNQWRASAFLRMPNREMTITRK